MVKVISPEAAAELKRLWEEYPKANARALAAFMTKGKPLEGELLRRFLEEDAKVAAIVRPSRKFRARDGKGAAEATPQAILIRWRRKPSTWRNPFGAGVASL
jgi:hypothetical protein